MPGVHIIEILFFSCFFSCFFGFFFSLFFSRLSLGFFLSRRFFCFVFKDLRVIIESFYLISIVLIFLEEIVVIEILQFLIRIEMCIRDRA